MKQFRQRQVPCNITYMRYLKYDTNEPIYEMERENGQREVLWLPGGSGLGKEWSGQLGLADANFYAEYG